MTDLLDLAVRVEGAEGPDRELDELISAALAGAEREVQPSGNAAYHTGTQWVSVHVWPYTASLDAAMGLVPEDARAHLNIAPDKISTAIVAGTEGIGNNPALALCAASLRARASQDASQ
jgi:hypothetical protein